MNRCLEENPIWNSTNWLALLRTRLMSARRSGYVRIFACLLVTQLCACATSYDSVCHELASTNAGQLRTMVRNAQRGNFERHVVLLETGTEINSICRSHFIDGDTYRGVPDSLIGHCLAQGNPADKYCMLYMLDGAVLKQPVDY